MKLLREQWQRGFPKFGNGFLAVFMAAALCLMCLGVVGCDDSDSTKCPVTITATAGANGKIDPAGEVCLKDGADQKFTFTPDAGFQVKEVLVDGEAVAVSNSYTFQDVDQDVDEDHTIKVSFEKADTKINVTASAGDHGAIDPAGEFTVDHGASQTFTVTPEAGYAVLSFTVNGEEKELTADNQFTVENIEGELAVEVNFAKELAIALPTLENGTIEGPSTTASGKKQTFTVKPAEGFAVYAVTVKGNPVVVKDDNTFEYEVTEEIKAEDIVVEFKTAYTITVPENLEHGAISPAGTIIVAEELEKKFTATPEEGYVVDQVLVNGEPVTVAGDNTFVITVAGNHEVSATFVKGLTIQASAGENGAIDPSGEVSVKEGGQVTFTLTPDGGYVLDALTVDDAPVAVENNTYILTATADHVVVASFKEVPPGHNVTASAGDHGAIEPAGEFTVENGASQTFTVTPEAGYAVLSFTVNGEEVALTADNQFTVENIEGELAVEVNFAKELAIALPTETELVNGTIEGPSTSASGKKQTFTVKPAEGFVVVQVTVKGNPVEVKDDNTFEYEVTEEIKAEDIEVEFKKAYTITVPENLDHGAITPAGTITLAEGVEQTFTATPEEGYAVGQVLVDGAVPEPPVAVADNMFVIKVAGNQEIRATFVKLWTIQASVDGGNGAIEPAEVSVKDGDQTTFTLTPDEGFAPDVLKVDEAPVDIVKQGGSYTYVLTASADHVLVATFKIDTTPQCPPDTSGMVDLSEAGDGQAGIGEVDWSPNNDNQYKLKGFAEEFVPEGEPRPIAVEVYLEFELDGQLMEPSVKPDGEYAQKQIVFVLYDQNDNAIGYYDLAELDVAGGTNGIGAGDDNDSLSLEFCP